MSQISSFSQRRGEQNNDLYMCNGVDVDLDEEKRESIYVLACEIQEGGGSGMEDRYVDVWVLKESFCFNFHTESRDAVGRVVDAVVVLESGDENVGEREIGKVIEAAISHCEMAGIKLGSDIYSHVGAIFRAIDSSEKKSWLQRLVNWIVSLLQQIIPGRK